MSNLKFAQGEKVMYSIGSGLENEIIQGKGEIVGCSTTGYPIIGCTYMVKDLSHNFPNKTYPFECIPVFENCLKKIEDYKIKEYILERSFGNMLFRYNLNHKQLTMEIDLDNGTNEIFTPSPEEIREIIRILDFSLNHLTQS